MGKVHLVSHVIKKYPPGEDTILQDGWTMSIQIKCFMIGRTAKVDSVICIDKGHTDSWTMSVMLALRN